MKKLALKIVTLCLLLKSLILPHPALALTCSPNLPSVTQCSNSENVDVTATVLESSVTFSGFAAGESIVSIQENGTTIGTVIASNDGTFSKTITSSQGIHNFGLYVTDNTGLSSPLVTFDNISVVAHEDTKIPNILLPPTINLDKTKITGGASVTIFGQGPPGATVNLFLGGKKIITTNVASNSKWSWEISSGYTQGKNNVWANFSKTGVSDSENSTTVTFEVTSCTSCPKEIPPPSSPTTPSYQPGKLNYKLDFNVCLDFGKNLTFILLTSIFITQIFVVLLIIFLLWRRRKKYKETHEVFKELETKVETDIKLDHPDLRVEKDLWEAERELDK